MRYKKSIISWENLIPSHWKEIKGKYLFTNEKEIIGDKWNHEQRISLTYDGVIPRDNEDLSGLNPESLATYQVVKENDLLFKLIDLENEKTSRVGLSSYNGITSSAYIRVNVNDMYPRYYFYWYYSLWFRFIYNRLGNGVRSTLNAKDLLDLFVPVPPKEEQIKLSEIIEKKTYKIDQLINNQQQQIEKLKEYKQSLISEVVTKGLDPNVEFKDSGVEWIGKIPKDAQLVQLKRLAIINNGKEIVNVDGEIPVYGSGGIFKYTDDYLFQGESILYGRKGTIDKPLHVNGKFWTVDTMFYTEISELVIPRYLYYVSIGSINFDYYKSGSVLPSMTQFELGNVLLPFFDKKSQEKIIEYLDYKTSLLDKVIEQKSSKIKKLEEFKKSLIYEYVTGKRIV